MDCCRHAQGAPAQHIQRVRLTCGPLPASMPVRVSVQQIMYCAFGGLAALILSGWYITVNFGGLYAPVPLLLIAIWYNFIYIRPVPGDTAKYITFHDAGLEKKYGKNKIPISVLYETYVDGDLEFKGDVLDTLMNHRDEFVTYIFTFDLLKFLVYQFLGPLSSSFKDMVATKKEIAAHYDRGNDFFRAFLGPRMVYTSGVYYEKPEWSKAVGKTPGKQIKGTSLEEAQDNKMSLIADRLQVKKGDKYLDIGCGWGTLMRHVAREFGAISTGVTLSVEGAKWCNEQIKKEGIKNADILRMDYREIPKENKYQAISAIEMAEHVGIANFQLFLGNISEMLEDDGMFLMQVAGLRKGANWQDTNWGLFMSKYIFPGADASTPLNWYVKQLEQAGFEVQRVENIGRHYSHTLHGWYDHWMENRKAILETEENGYDGELCRLWDFFLAWSVVASGQCSATCYQLLCHKNIYDFPRDRFCDASAVGLHNGTRGRVDPPGGEPEFSTPLEGDKARSGKLAGARYSLASAAGSKKGAATNYKVE